MTDEELLAEEYICNGKCQDDTTRNYVHCRTCTRLRDFLAGLKAGKEIEREYVKNNAFTSMKEQGLFPMVKWHNLNENYKDLPDEGEWVEGLYIWYYKDKPHWDVFKVRWYYEIGELDEKLVRWYGADEWNTYDLDYWNKVDEPDYWKKITLPMRNEHDRTC